MPCALVRLKLISLITIRNKCFPPAIFPSMLFVPFFSDRRFWTAVKNSSTIVGWKIVIRMFFRCFGLQLQANSPTAFRILMAISPDEVFRIPRKTWGKAIGVCTYSNTLVFGGFMIAVKHNLWRTLMLPQTIWSTEVCFTQSRCWSFTRVRAKFDAKSLRKLSLASSDLRNFAQITNNLSYSSFSNFDKAQQWNKRHHFTFARRKVKLNVDF